MIRLRLIENTSWVLVTTGWSSDSVKNGVWAALIDCSQTSSASVLTKLQALTVKFPTLQVRKILGLPVSSGEESFPPGLPRIQPLRSDGSFESSGKLFKIRNDDLLSYDVLLKTIQEYRVIAWFHWSDSKMKWTVKKLL